MSDGPTGMMLALLAAGQSARFGDGDKLAALLHGKMLGLHAAEALSAMSFTQKIVIANPGNQACRDGWTELGYEVVANEQAVQGQSTSVALAATRAIAQRATALCIALADMPFVTGAHVETLIAQFDVFGQATIVASARRDRSMPPAIFPASQFGALRELEGDQGARHLLAQAKQVRADDALLIDIDTPDQLAELNDQTGPQHR